MKAGPGMRPGRFRWVICALLFLVTANNYLDRQVLGVLAPELIRDFRWTPAEYAEVVFWFQVAFAIGFPLAGRFLDVVGTRWGFAVAVTIWSVASASHGLVSSLAGFKIARFVLGLSQPANMPAGVKTTAEWFEPGERALAMGVFKGGANFGAVLAPLAVPWLYVAMGWRGTFVTLGITGLVWVGLWLCLYRPAAPRDPVAPEPALAGPAIGWRALLGRRETWAYMNFKFMTDAVWHWYLAMLPLFFSQRFGLRLADFGPPLVTIYVLGYGGSVGAGWLSSRWIARGWDLTRARKTAMFICCASTIPVLLVTQAPNLWTCVAIIGLAHAAHQGLTSNLFTAVSDLFPRQAIGSVIGLGGTAAQIGAALMTLATGWQLSTRSQLTGLFFVAGSAYVVAFVIFHLLVPRLEPLAWPSPARNAG